MAITLQGNPTTEPGGQFVALFRSQVEAADELTEKMAALTRGTSNYTKEAKASTKATSDLSASLVMLSGMALTSFSSIEALVGGLTAMVASAAGAPPQLAVLISSLTKVSVALNPGIMALRAWSAGLRGAGKIAVSVGKITVSAFKKLATLGVAAFKRLGTFAVETFKKLAQAAVAMGKKVLNALKNLAIGIAGAVVAIMALPVALDKLFQKVMVGAGRLEGIKAAFYATGDAAGKMFEQLKKGSFGLIEDIDLMEKYNFAALLVSKTFADELPEALGYVSKIALATGEDLTYLMDSYIRGVGRLSPKILDNLAIQVSLAEAIAWATVEYGKAADQLTVYEKQTGMAAVATEKLAAKTEGLADPTGTLVYLMGRYNVIMAENARLLASHFLPVSKAFYTVMNDLGEMFRKSISEGGKYYNVLRKLSAGFTGLIQSVGELVTRFATGGSEAVDAFADKMFQAAWNAFEWGANIINNLAIGMARGITTTLMTVINMLSNFLSYWLSPGSAPKIVPNLLAWGASTFTEYLRGFTMADFGVLTGLQAPLEGALDNLVALGTITPEQAGQMFINLSEAMAAAIATGDVEGAMAQLAAVGGEYGAELEKLFRRQLAVADATNAVEEAQRRLTAARNLEEASGKKLSRQARDYNRLLREGASDAVLKAKLAELKATYGTLEGARDAAEVAEEDKKLAEERLKIQQELMQTQNALLQQLIKMGQVFADIGAGDGDGLLPDPEDILPPFASVIDEIDKAFDDLKNSIKAKFDALWADLRAAWEESGVGTLIEDLKQKWQDSALKEWWDAFILDVSEEGIRTALENLWLKLAKTAQAFLDDKYPSWGDVWRAFTQKGIEDGTGRVDFGAAINQLWMEFAPKFGNWLTEKVPWLGDVWKAFTEEGHGRGVRAVSLDAGFEIWWGKVEDGIVELGGKFGELLGSTLIAAILGVFGLVSGTFDGEQEGSFWIRLGKSFASGLVKGFGDGIFEQQPALFGLLAGFYNVVANWFGVHSASTKFAGLGRDLVAGFVQGLSGMGNAVKGVFNSVIDVIQNAINNIISGVNQLIWAIGNATGAWASYVSYVNLPRLDRGGLITATEQLAVVHKNEIVLPLQDPRTVDLMADAMRGAFGQVRDADAAPAPVVNLTLNFGRDSVRSERDIMKIADQTERALELRGVRGGIK